MKTQNPTILPSGVRPDASKARAQSGVVLIIAMIMLILISLLAVTSMRNSASSEALAGNVRTTEMATQAAEIALRHCESSVVAIMSVAAGATSTGYVTTITSANILPPSTPPSWQNLATWDTSTTATFVLPSSLVGGTATFKRPPECMMEALPVISASSTTPNSSSSFVITARGFGPEVSAITAPARPNGTEVWLQSHIQLE